MLAIVVEFRVQPAFVERFERAIVANATASRDTEPGCRQFDVCRDPAEPTVFYLYELYEDAAAFDAHCRSDHFRDMDALTVGWVQSKQVHRYQRISP